MKYAFVSVLLFVGFAVLTVLVLTNNAVTNWDQAIFQIINSSHGKIFDEIMFVFSSYGREVVWIGITALLFVFGKSDGRKVAVLLVVVFLILIPIGTFLKDIIHRDRPVPLFDAMLLKSAHDDPSFPSGHALIVTAGACVLLFQYNTGKRKIISLILAAEAILVMYSVLDVGAHYPLDVVGGALLGTGTSIAVIGSKKYLMPLFALELFGRKKAK